MPLVLFRTRLFGSLERPKRPTALPSTTHAPHPTRHPPRTRVPHSFHELVKTFCCGHGLRPSRLGDPKTHSRGVRHATRTTTTAPTHPNIPAYFSRARENFWCGHGLRARVVLETPKRTQGGFGTPLAQPLQLRPTRTSPHTFHELVKTFGAGTACALESSWRPQNALKGGSARHSHNHYNFRPTRTSPHTFHELVKTFFAAGTACDQVVLETPKTHSRGVRHATRTTTTAPSDPPEHPRILFTSS